MEAGIFGGAHLLRDIPGIVRNITDGDREARIPLSI